VFEEVARRRGGRRAAARAPWLVGSALFHLGLALALVWAALHPGRSPETVVEVKFVKGAPASANPLRPPLALPAPPPPRRPARRDPVSRAPGAPAPVIQPREVPADLPHPSPAESPEPPDPGAEDGVVGGAAGAGADGAAAGLPAPAAGLPPPAFDEHTMTRPTYLSGPSPEFTRKALQREVEGLMVVRCVITVDGEVRDCRVLQGLPFMDEATVEALQRRRYRPAMRGGVPVAVTWDFRITLKQPR
jgi:protein TonB